MRKIVPFNNVLTFETDVASITAISLEHDIHTSNEAISGTFYISGEYKITDGQLEGEKFNFELPFDIALGSDYDMDSLQVDIDDFRYELIKRNNLKVNIDLYIEGEIIEKPLPISEETVSILNEESNNEDIPDDLEDDTQDELRMLDNYQEEEIIKENDKEIIDDYNDDKMNDDLINDIIVNNEEDKMEETNINIENNNINDNDNINENKNDNENNDVAHLFDGNNYPEQFVTYRVYRVDDGDTIDKIIEKYNTNKEELMKYNNIEDIKVGDKLIIPANDK